MINRKNKKKITSPSKIKVSVDKKYIAIIVCLFLIVFGLFSYQKRTVANKIYSDHTLAESIPRYPNATNYRISSGSGFPDGVPSTEIYFQTNDSDDVVINWYISTLKKQGWKVVNRNDRKNDLKEANVEMWKINKNTIYTINVHKYDYSDNNAIRDKVSISVDHTFFREKMFKQME